MKFFRRPVAILFVLILSLRTIAQSPDHINFVRQGVKRVIFDKEMSIPLASLKLANIIGFPVMHPFKTDPMGSADVSIQQDQLVVRSKSAGAVRIWMGGFNPFATYSIDLGGCTGEGSVGFEFTDALGQEKLQLLEEFKDSLVIDVKMRVINNGLTIFDKSIAIGGKDKPTIGKSIIVQMLGSGLMIYNRREGLPQVVTQADFNKFIDLRDKKYLQDLQTKVFVGMKSGSVKINSADAALTAGMGLADIRPITYEDGEPMLDQGRIWYTMSIRGRGLPHPLQGVFSLDPTVFDIKFEGIIVFDRNNGLLRNEVASYIFYHRKDKMWRGVTTGFSAYAKAELEKKQLLIIESKRDPRHGFSVMNARPFDMVGDIEDPQILYDPSTKKWRMIACKDQGGYKAAVLESDNWDGGYRQIAGPVSHNSTGTSLQKIGDKVYAFSGSNENKLFVYNYPDLKEVGTLKMDLPPWSETSGSRIWPNVVQLPDGYPFRYVALMMDRFNYPGAQGQNWTYGALYLYHGY